MTDHSPAHEGVHVGSVAEEAARLVDAFAAWTTTQRAASAGGEQDAGHGYAGGPGAAGPAGSAGHGSPERAGGGADDTARERPQEGSGAGAVCEACGAQTGVGRAASCGVCPVCQGITWLRSVRPETLDRLADLAGMLTDTLREVARQGWAGTARSQDETPGTAPRRDASVQHILVEDDADDDESDGARHDTDDTDDTEKRTRQ